MMVATAVVFILSCGGGGTAVKPDVRTVQGNGNFSGTYDYGRGNFNGSSSYSGTDIGTRDRGYSDQVDVEINGETGRIRLPHLALPIAHGGTDGWFEIKNLVVTERAVSGNAAVNFINKPKVHIDRMTGVISINGKSGNFNGRCQSVDANVKRQF